MDEEEDPAQETGQEPPVREESPGVCGLLEAMWRNVDHDSCKVKQDFESGSLRFVVGQRAEQVQVDEQFQWPGRGESLIIPLTCKRRLKFSKDFTNYSGRVRRAK